MRMLAIWVQPIDEEDELVVTQRSALVVHHLGVLGEWMTTHEIAAMVGLTYHGARKLLKIVSSARGADGVGVPLVEVDGYWGYLREERR